MKPTSRKKSRATLTKMKIVLTVDDFDFIITVVANVSQDILWKHEAKKEEMYDRIEVELGGVQQDLQSIRIVSIASPPLEEPYLGDEPNQLHRLADATKDHLRQA
jgi:hypothetical protein